MGNTSNKNLLSSNEKNQNSDEFYSIAMSPFSSAGLFYLKYLFRKWIVIFLAGCLATAIGIYLYTQKKQSFEASSTFMLEEKQSGLGGLSSLASQFGFDIGGGGGSIFSGDNILEILKSRRILKNVLLSKIDTNSNKRLIDLYIEFKGWKSKWKEHEKLKDINFYNVSPVEQKLTLQQDSVLGLVHKGLTEKNLVVERLIKKGSLIKVSFKESNEVFCKLLVERVIDDAKAMYVQLKTNNSSINVRRLEKKADSLLRLLNVKSYQTAGSVVIDVNPGLKTLSVPTELNQRDKVVLQTLYGEVVKNLEISRIALMQQTPVIEVLDEPTFPLTDKSKKLPFYIVISFVLGALLSVGVLLLRLMVKRS
jgi:hypothetical protein